MEIMTLAKLEMNTIKTLDYYDSLLKEAELNGLKTHIEHYKECLETLKKMKALFP